MVIVRIVGGIGNQLFTYACGYAVAKRSHQELVLDISDYSNGYFRLLALDAFNLDPCKKMTYKYMNNKVGRELLRQWLKIRYHFIKDQTVTKFQSTILEMNQPVYLYGYWQNEQYFISFSQEIRRQFSLKNNSKQLQHFLQEIESLNSVAVHIRRGDYLQNKWELKMSYYFEAMAYMKSKVSNATFLFFSDDLTWVKEQFGDQPEFRYVSFDGAQAEIDEFVALSKCKNAIIANSTFSWWAGWLNNHTDKIIVAPEYGIWAGDYYPEDWIKIQVDVM